VVGDQRSGLTLENCCWRAVLRAGVHRWGPFNRLLENRLFALSNALWEGVHRWGPFNRLLVESLERHIRSGSGRSEGVEWLGCPVVEGRAGRVVAADCCSGTTDAVLAVVVFFV